MIERHCENIREALLLKHITQPRNHTHVAKILSRAFLLISHFLFTRNVSVYVGRIATDTDPAI